ncbi:MAG: tRNA adenosine(34) deaminase TadA [Candidatus Zapsychrus exili]|nr:tRNA adenosine(34) deaminase TadA [Candidatus Zapsychrus exili]
MTDTLDMQHVFFMQEALKQAKQARDKDEVPVGTVVVFEGKIIAKAHNQVEMLKDPTAHAEMIAITQATSCLSSKWLENCSMYVTIEPCSMCAGALVLARIKNLYFGAADSKAGACGSVMNIVENKQLNHRVDVFGGVLAEECSNLMKKFFKTKR